LSKVIKAYAGELPTSAVVAQFFDPVTETDQQKWLLGFDMTPAAAKFLANKEWIRVACHEKGADIGIGKWGRTSEDCKQEGRQDKRQRKG
jgi:hypothetical protein